MSIHSKRTYGAAREKIPIIRLRRFAGVADGKYPALCGLLRAWREKRILTGRSHKFADRLLP